MLMLTWEARFWRKRHAEDAITQYRESLRLAPENIAAQSNLAWLLATCSEPSLRNGPEAVFLAENASRLSGSNQPFNLRILAAAYAETGRFADAVKTAQQALRLAEVENNTILVNALRKEIALYQSRIPYRERG
jgi:cytochrome c-type biogenesis protein CcmH/NrfG